MSEGLIYMDCFSGHKLELLEIRRDGNNLYHDLTDNTRVICKLAHLTHPPRRKAFAPVGASHASV